MKLGIASGDRIPASRSSDNKSHWGGAGWVRLGQYQGRLDAVDIETYNGTLVWNRDHFVIDITDGAQYFVEVDVIYLQRLMHDSLAEHIRKARASGQVIINDLDDWYWGLSPANSAFASSHPKTSPNENVNHYKSVLNASTVVTVSTPYLADRIKSFVHCPIEVIPNTVDTGRFFPHEHTDSTVPVVGWVGSTNHRSNDLEILHGIIDPLYKAGEVKLQHSGYHRDAPTVASKWGLPDDAVITLGATDPENYPSLMTMDVGVAPLSDTPFNHAKSDIKLLEYSAAGIPWIGSGLSAYTQLAQDWGIGRIASKPKHWISHIKTLKNPDIRSAEGEQLREAVKQRDIGVGTKQLAGLLKSLTS